MNFIGLILLCVLALLRPIARFHNPLLNMLSKILMSFALTIKQSLMLTSRITQRNRLIFTVICVKSILLLYLSNTVCLLNCTTLLVMLGLCRFSAHSLTN